MTNETLDGHSDTSRIATSQSGAMTLAALEAGIGMVEVSAPMETVLEVHTKLEFMSQQVRELKKRMDAQLIAWIEANGSITCGTKRWYVGSKKETKCKDLAPAIEALLADCGGDFEMLCRCLSANAIKYGAAKTVMKPESYDKHFQVITKTELREGVETPVKQLIEADERFTR